MLPLLFAIGLGQARSEPLPIIGGEPVPDGEFEAVVRVDLLPEALYCSGTLVRPDVVLTAAHCVERINRASELEVHFESTTTGSVGVVDFGVHPDYCGERCVLDRFDYAYVRLERPLDIEPVPIVTDQEVWDATMRLGSVVTVVGFGAVPGVASGGYERWMVDVPVRGFTIRGIEFIAGGDGKDSCEGDSGGPAFVTAPGGSLQLVGVTSRGSEECGDGGYYGVAYHALAWLSDQLGDSSLCADDCGTCDCLDTSPLPKEEGCCSTGRPRDVPWLAPLLVFLLVRRRPARLP